ncbi:MAG: 50S ribosomal protein L25 [Ignavibacteriae bacterium HGW-Ignavibacteriae-3]|nr:MAG: 50S ribosomal protein L25 [Ignavibacteriae bacterium HGW-Ignavibacteriae-3]
MSEILVNGNKRTLSTKGANNQLRRDGNVPGIFYMKGLEPIPVFISEKALKPIVFTAEAHIINLKIDGADEHKSILKNVQFDPVTDRVVHFDLLGISADQEIEIEVPVVFEGQSKGVKDGGIVQQSIHKVTVSCLPRHIPEHIAINITDLGINDAVHIRDLSIENVKFLQNPEVIIVSVVLPRAAVEPTPATEVAGEEPAEPEVIGKGKQTDEEE